MCEELSYQIIDTPAVDKAVFCYIIRSLQKSL